MVGYHNEAIDEAESEIHKLNEDYFFTSSSLTMTQGASDISLPSTIYASKIRGLVYQNGTDTYEVEQIRNVRLPSEIQFTNSFNTSAPYRYFLKNDSATTGVKLSLSPAARVSGAYLTLYFIRNANRIPLIADGSLAATEATTIDIPEFINFIMQFVKVRVLEKEGGPRHGDALMKLEQQRKQMIETLTEKIVDNDTEVIQDLSYYQEHS